MDRRDADGVLITGVYGSGKSSAGAEIAYVREQRGEPYALLDLDCLSWAGTDNSASGEEFGLMVLNLTDVRVTTARLVSGYSYWLTSSVMAALCRLRGRR